ncbi:MAG: transglycosylase SLT domain-containing protein [Gammaproteobacteria bacterium]
MPKTAACTRSGAGPLVRVLPLFLLFLAGPATAGNEIERQREQFREARQTLQDGHVHTFRDMAAQLEDYPLYPYLIHDYLRPRLWKAKDGEVIDFLERFDDLPMASNIRRSWLKLLARRGHWQTFLEHYAPENDTVLECYQVRARMKTGGDETLLEDIRALWLAGKSQPSECDPAFERLYQSDLMTPALLWQRIELAMEEGQTGLAQYLARRLDDNGKQWAKRWVDMHHNPARGTNNIKYGDGDRARSIIVHGITRLARRNTALAISRWEKLRQDFGFTPEQINSVTRTLAVYAVINEHEKAKQLLDRIPHEKVDESVFQWRLRLALENGDWAALVDWTDRPPPDDDAVKLRWRYWRARALENTGEDEAARNIYQSLAGERDYYGFLAADRLGAEYNLNHASLTVDEEVRRDVAARPAVIRARELYALGMTYSARREWYHLLRDMTAEEMSAVAMIAAEWGWHDRTILTLGKAQAFDDLVLRFPKPYESLLEQYAVKRGLDLSWIYAVTRAESAFMEDARSPAGALGLMQVMPATGRQTALSIGFRTFHTSYLLRADRNVTIGTAYLKQMYDKFEGNKILATAAYNAGPHNVVRWLPDSECNEPDIWIEKIPYTETRKYVARILYYATIYDWRLKQEISPVRERMAVIQPRKENLVTAIQCAITNLTQN